jgi:hypothetical protein
MTPTESENVFSDQDGNNVFRWDLEGYDKEYIEELIETFLQDATRYGRKLIEVRMRLAMLEILEIHDTHGAHFRNVPIAVVDTGFDGTIELVLGPLS